MSKMRVILYFVLVNSLTSCIAPYQAPAPVTRKTAMANGPALIVTFEGLIAYAKTTRNKHPVLWALLPNANYDPNHPTKEALPPCVLDELVTPIALAKEAPPHVAVMLINHANVKYNNGKPSTFCGGIALQGRDVRFSTGQPQDMPDLKLAANAQHLVDTRGGSASNYVALNTVNGDYIHDDTVKFENLGYLASRILIDFGDKVDEEILSCGSPLVYGFQAPPDDKNACMAKKAINLGEGLIVTQMALNTPIKVSLLPSSDVLTIEPDGTGTVEIKIVNATPMALCDATYKPCDDRHRHKHSFRWYYRFLAAPPACQDQFFPCDPPRSGQTKGGSKCPQKALVE